MINFVLSKQTVFMDYKLVIFDFDGTLADTTQSILETYHATFDALGVMHPSDIECRSTIGVPLREGFRMLFPDSDDLRLDEFVTTYRAIYAANQQCLVPELFPYVVETLEAFSDAGIKMSIASSRSRASLKAFCMDRGIEKYFSLILGCEDVAKPKPDPTPVFETLLTFCMNPDEALVVGDMPVDISMGRGAGCRTVGVTYGNSSAEALMAAGATFVINDLKKLSDIVLTQG